MNFTYEDLFQKPYFYHKSVFNLNPFVASQLSYIKRIENYPFYFFETLMPEPPKNYGSGLIEDGLNYGHGSSFKNPEEALTKSIFEALERKFSKIYNPTKLIFDSYHNLKKRAVNPEIFSLPSREEYKKNNLPYVPYTPKLRLGWIKSYQVFPKKMQPVLIPAALVYSRYSWRNKKEWFTPNLSPGIACHLNYRNSFLRGLLELIERDAFMITWLHQLICPKIKIESKDLNEAQAVFDHLTFLGFSVDFINITTDINIPVILTIITNPSLNWNKTMVLGLGCHLSPLLALKKSFLEALSAITNYLYFDYEKKEIKVYPEKVKKKFSLNYKVYYKQAEFLGKSKNSLKIKDIPGYDRQDAGKNLEYLIQHLNQKELETFFIDLTPNELKESHAFCLTRALISGIQPMLYETDCWRFSNKRVFTAKSQMGKTTKKITQFKDLFLAPHPLAGM